MSNRSPIPGKKIVFALFSLAILLCLTVFFFGLREKHRRRAGLPEVTATASFPIRDILNTTPKEWSQISWIEGQGWRIYVPCNGHAAKLHIAPDTSDRPMLQCDYCGSVDKASILKVMRFAGGGKLQMDLGGLGTTTIEQVTDVVSDRFGDAPVKGYVLTWHSSANDSLVFVPTSDADNFETLKAEDESPEGCSGR